MSQGRRSVMSALTLWCMVAVYALGVPGCGGCRQDDPAGKDTSASGQQEEVKPFKFSRLEVVPSDDALLRNFTKPGHAFTASLSAVAQLEDTRAELTSEVTTVEGTPVAMGDTRYHLVMARPVVLPKGQRKTLEFTCFMPHEVSDTGGLFLRYTLQLARGGSVVHSGSEGTRLLPAYQYLFVVLADNPNTYGYLKQLESVRPAFNELQDAGPELVYYRVVLPAAAERVPVPAYPFAWTMIAYVLWDGAAADRMTPDQQQAMLSWLHWGGQLIVSGPGSLDQLAGTFLAPYLPAKSDGTVELGAAEFQPLNAYWSLTPRRQDTRLARDVVTTSPLVGVRLQRQAAGVALEGAGALALERRVGRGRIVVTAFSLNAREVVNWSSYDSFFNNALLRRPRRVFTARGPASVQTSWADLPQREQDPRLVTATRYFTRDAGRVVAAAPAAAVAEEADWHLDGSVSGRPGGVASWNDESGVAVAAHRALQEAAGISIPQAAFVLRVLLIYLALLVPVNWCVFRLWGRVEWAWAAAPLIAIVGAAVVIRLAQLDIGFVRSRTEVGVLEMHAGHPAAHLTRYTALYSSLSTSYELQFDDPTGIARPFPPTPSPDRARAVIWRRDEGIEVRGFQVDSNTTTFLHSEQMHQVGGTVQLADDGHAQWSVENGTPLNLQDVQLFHRTSAGVRVCALPVLPAGAAARVAFTRLAERPARDVPEDAVRSGTRPRGDDMGIQELMELAAWGTTLRPGDVRLVAWTDDTLAGLSIVPQASQSRIRTVVLVHLRYGPLPPAAPDANLRVDIQASPGAADEDGIDAL